MSVKCVFPDSPPSTCVGLLVADLFPIPNSPLALYPHAQTVPSFLIANTFHAPVVINLMS